MFATKTPWIVLLVLWMMGSTWWHVCKIKQLCANDVLPSAATVDGTAPVTPVGEEGLTIADGSNFRIDLPGNFSFARSSANASLNSLGGSLESVVNYLKQNPSRTLEIVGYYRPDETNSTGLSDLGLARAEGIKQYFVQQGIPESSLTIKGVERQLPIRPGSDSIQGGIAFTFAGAKAVPTSELPTPTADTVTTTPTTSVPAPITLAAGITEEELAAAEKFKSVFEPIDLYFPLAEANYIKTPDTQKFFDEAAKYLATHKDKKLVLTGHTDNSGPDEVNLRLSRDRANGVKSRLRKSGIDLAQIEVDAKGEAEPKAPNETREGRKANRRVTVVVQ